MSPGIRYDKWLAEFMVHRDEVAPDPLNDNNGDVDEVIESVTVNGCYRPIYAHPETKLITGGHTLYAALLEMGATYVPVAWGDPVDDDTHKRRLVGDNQIARLARPDAALTVQLLKGLRATDVGLRGTGFTEDQYLRIVASSGGGESSWMPRMQEPTEMRQTVCPECGHRWTP